MEEGDGDSEVDLDLLDDDSYQLVLPSGESGNTSGLVFYRLQILYTTDCSFVCFRQWWCNLAIFVHFPILWSLLLNLFNLSFCYNSYLAFNNVNTFLM